MATTVIEKAFTFLLVGGLALGIAGCNPSDSDKSKSESNSKKEESGGGVGGVVLDVCRDGVVEDRRRDGTEQRAVFAHFESARAKTHGGTLAARITRHE